ncbi:MAG: hypothetical protein RXQ22_02315 [Sulfolobus sp.]
MPVKLTAYEVQVIKLVIISFVVGLIIGLLHVRLRFNGNSNVVLDFNNYLLLLFTIFSLFLLMIFYHE